MISGPDAEHCTLHQILDSSSRLPRLTDANIPTVGIAASRCACSVAYQPSVRVMSVGRWG